MVKPNDFNSCRWGDRAAAVEKCEILLSINLGTRIVEIRKTPEEFFFLTVGNLYGSQTLQVLNLETVVRMVNKIYEAGDYDQIERPVDALFVYEDGSLHKQPEPKSV